uniref:PPM-type phosphatase domain-containing protein n=1 Tax=Compsopogon caeruleus TaxID=31354 RepID=A0A7S1TBJ4_9RHOD
MGGNGHGGGGIGGAQGSRANGGAGLSPQVVGSPARSQFSKKPNVRRGMADVFGSNAPVYSIGYSDDQNSRYRNTMEDAHVIINCFGGNSHDAFFAVYDGHGGREAVDIVVKILHNYFEEELGKDPDSDPQKAFFHAYLRVDKTLLENNCLYQGTTSVTCYIHADGDQRVLYTANVGDARAVLSSGGSAIRLTYDHKASDELENKRVCDSGGFVAAKRVNGVLSVSRALGDHAMKSVVISAPYTTKSDLSGEAQFLLLACDGLWDVITDEEAVRFVCERYAKGMDVQQISKRLVRAALEKGSTDNISVMVVRL